MRRSSSTRKAVLPNVSCPEIVTDGCVLTFLAKQLVEYAGHFEACSDRQTLLLDLLWLLVSGNRKTERILLFLAQQESKEIDPWLRDDLRISWLTVLYAGRGYAEPHVTATYGVLGLHPSKVYAAILERRKALLGPTLAALDALPPKKPVQAIGKPARSKKETA